MKHTKNTIGTMPKLDKLTQTGKSSGTAAVQGTRAGKTGTVPEAMQSCMKECERLLAKFKDRTTLEIWQTIKEEAQELSNKMHVCKLKYLVQAKNCGGDPETLELFCNAARVASEELFAVSTLATFIVQAELRQPNNADKLTQMFAEAFWDKGDASFDRMVVQIFGAKESNG